SNSSYYQHICLHYGEYQQRCMDGNITENEHVIPRDMLAMKKRQQVTRGMLQDDMPGQMTLDGTFTKAVPGLKAFSRDDVLKSVAEFVVCGDQVCSQVSSTTVALTDNHNPYYLYKVS
ncbi:hypothetical protein SCLCIDRAFT_120633, partial [Scleroderma citrinum Foug A]